MRSVQKNNTYQCLGWWCWGGHTPNCQHFWNE